MRDKGLMTAALHAVVWAAIGSPMSVVAQTAPPLPLTVSGDATLVSDYRFRGLSRSDRDVAVQASATATLQSGFYASVWGSSVANYVAPGSDAELDLIAGYRKAAGGVTIDGGLLYYAYPGGTRADFFEPYASAAYTLGPVTAKVGANLAWKQRALGLGGDVRGGAYAHADLSAGVPGTGLTVSGHLGRSLARNAITFGERYTDWAVNAAYSLRRFTLGVGYADTDRTIVAYPGTTRANPISQGGIVASIGVAF